MALDESELLERTRKHVQKACHDVKKAMADLGTSKDSLARDRLRRTRAFVQQCESKVAPTLHVVNPDLKYLKDQYLEAKSFFAQLDMDARRRERQTVHHDHTSSVSGTAELNDEELAEYTEVLFQDVKPVAVPATSSLRTEEAYQRERLRGVREIESDLRDLKTTYDDFQALVAQQQEDVNTISKHVQESKTFVDRGCDHIQTASRSQGRFRKFGGIVGAAIAVVVLVVIIIIVIQIRS